MTNGLEYVILLGPTNKGRAQNAKTTERQAQCSFNNDKNKDKNIDQSLNNQMNKSHPTRTKSHCTAEV